MTVAATAPPPSPPCPRSCAASGGAASTSSPSPPTRAQHNERPATRSSQNRPKPGGAREPQGGTAERDGSVAVLSPSAKDDVGEVAARTLLPAWGTSLYG